MTDPAPTSPDDERKAITQVLRKGYDAWAARGSDVEPSPEEDQADEVLAYLHHTRCLKPAVAPDEQEQDDLAHFIIGIAAMSFNEAFEEAGLILGWIKSRPSSATAAPQPECDEREALAKLVCGLEGQLYAAPTRAFERADAILAAGYRCPSDPAPATDVVTEAINALMALASLVQNDRGTWKIRKAGQDMQAIVDEINRTVPVARAALAGCPHCAGSHPIRFTQSGSLRIYTCSSCAHEWRVGPAPLAPAADEVTEAMILAAYKAFEENDTAVPNAHGVRRMRAAITAALAARR